MLANRQGHNHTAVADMYKELIDKSKDLRFSLVRQGKPINKQLHACVAVLNRMPEHFDEVASAFAKLTENKARIVEETPVYEKLGPQNILAMRFIAAVNKEIRPYNNETTASMKLVTANLFLEGEQVWDVVDDRLIQRTPDDLEKILAARRSLVTVSGLEGLIEFQPKNGDFVGYIADDGSERIGNGYVFKTAASLMVGDMDSGQAVPIKAVQIIECIDGSKLTTASLPDLATTASEDGKPAAPVSLSLFRMPFEGNLNNTDSEKLLAIMYQIYGQWPDFYRRIAAQIRGQAGKYNSTHLSPQQERSRSTYISR